MIAAFTPEDAHYFSEGTHTRVYEKLGVHLCGDGARCAVWAPNARAVSVIGDFNGWRPAQDSLPPAGHSGVWQGAVAGIRKGQRYKFHIESQHGGYVVDKADPYGLYHEVSPGTASVAWDLDYEWRDGDWLRNRSHVNGFNSPISIYELHLGSWRRVPDEGNRPFGYREIAPLLIDYVKQSGFTHVEFLPVMEHPFFGSWGYQITGFFAPTSRYGTPQDLMWLIDQLHQNGIGVILDWVPSHFPQDEYGLAFFDGTHLYEYSGAEMRVHADWNSFQFDYGRGEVRSFLLSNAMFWLGKYHADGLRVDAVAAMLYRGDSRGENLEAVDFLKKLNTEVYAAYPDVQTFAEESTAWPMVSRPTYMGGLGFGFKWDMGWMHDTLKYLSHDPLYRRYHHQDLTFRMMYAFSENFVLPLSHDEVVRGYRSLLNKMPGDEWQKFANLRTLLAYMYTQPGKKLLFMGAEFGARREWNHDESLDWDLLNLTPHQQLRLLTGTLNHLYRSEVALHQGEISPDSFEWIDCCDSDRNVLTYIRRAPGTEEKLLVACHFNPIVVDNYRIGVPGSGMWREILNTDAAEFGGSGRGNYGATLAYPVPLHGQSHSMTITLPPLAVLVFKWERGDH